jgi:hypothetical protein
VVRDVGSHVECRGRPRWPRDDEACVGWWLIAGGVDRAHHQPARFKRGLRRSSRPGATTTKPPHGATSAAPAKPAPGIVARCTAKRSLAARSERSESPVAGTEKAAQADQRRAVIARHGSPEVDRRACWLEVTLRGFARGTAGGSGQELSPGADAGRLRTERIRAADDHGPGNDGPMHRCSSSVRLLHRTDILIERANAAGKRLMRILMKPGVGPSPLGGGPFQRELPEVW